MLRNAGGVWLNAILNTWQWRATAIQCYWIVCVMYVTCSIHAVTYEWMCCYSERQASADLCNGMSTNWRLYPGTQLASRLSSTLQILSSHFVGSSLLTHLRYMCFPMCRHRTWPRSPFSVALSTILPDVHLLSGVVVWMGQGLNRGNPGISAPLPLIWDPPPLTSDPHL